MKRFVFVFGWFACCALQTVGEEKPVSDIGRQIANFRLPSCHGDVVSLADFKDKKAIVVVFTGTACPLNNQFMPVLVKLYHEFAARGVQFLAINANAQDSLSDVARHAKEFKIPFPVLKDAGNKVADVFRAERTPEAFLLDASHRLRYRGRISDQFGIGYARPQPKHDFLADAINQLLAGEKVTTPITQPEGCLIGREIATKKTGRITYARQIARILQENCQECHRPGQIGPMPLLTYQDAVAWSGTIREVVMQKRMPPWYADPRFGSFANDRRLSKKEIDLLLEWIDSGLAEGDPKDLPPPKKFDPGWRLGKPDLIVAMPKAFSVPAKMPAGGVPYQYFHVDPGFKEDRWVIRAEAKAGAPSVVHHVLVFIVPPGERFFPGNPKTPALGGTAPGDMPLILPSGVAKKIPAGSKLVFQMHYTPNGTPAKDRSSIGLTFAKKPPRYEAQTVPIYTLRFRIPPGADNHRVEASFRFDKNGHLLNFMPHMHLRGKDFRYVAIYPDGKKETLLFVPRYDFNWQSVYRLARPLPVPKGTIIQCIAHYDNSANNPNNPDPTRAVYWGDQTWQEMMIGWLDFYYDE
ncbi:MAG: thiol-disulfide isomerase [Gemmatales bacterium]|nr:MAG: thiol-disulfide isomerase [Gemmatales bacterium]